MTDLAATCERIAVELAAELQREILRRLRPRRPRPRRIAVRPPPRELQPAPAAYDSAAGIGHEDELGPAVGCVEFCG